MISGRKTPRNNSLFSINHQIYEKMSSKKKLNNPPNFNVIELSTLYLTPSKFQKYSSIYSKHKSYSKASTKRKTISNSKSQKFVPSSLNRFNQQISNSGKKYPSLITNFNNNILNPQTPNRKSRNVHSKFKKNATMEKKINYDKFYPSIQNLNNNNRNNQSQSLLRNTVKNLSISYKNFFLNKKKISIPSINTNIKKNINNNNKKNNNVQICKTHRIKKRKISINDNEYSRNKFEKNNDANNKIIKSIINLRYLQHKIQDEFQKKTEAIMKKIKVKNYEEDYIKEFSFNKDYTNNNYSNDDDYINNYKNNNEDLIDIYKKRERCNLIKSKLMKKENNGIYEENYECDTPQFTTLDEQKSK